MAETLQQDNVSAAFSKQSAIFDSLEKENHTIKWMRNRVRQHALSYWRPGQHILELNAGTGLDAIFFAEKGMYVYTTDGAIGMVNELKRKVAEIKLEDRIKTEHLSFLELNKLGGQTFDHIFSNFGGLNCTQELGDVINSFSALLKPTGTATLVIMPPVCPWEMLLALKGNTKVAFRRLKKEGAISNVEGVSFKSYYYSPSHVVSMFGKDYETLSIEGLCSIVPPPYLENGPVKYPTIFNMLTSLEIALADAWPFHACADHFIITMKKLA